MQSIEMSALLCCYTTDSSQNVYALERLREISTTNTIISLRAATRRLSQACQRKRTLKRVQAIRNIYLTPYDKARKGFLEKEIYKAERTMELAQSAMIAANIKLYKLKMGHRY